MPNRVMQKTTLRISRPVLQIIQEEAEHDGISTAQFIREAALAAAIRRRMLRGHDPDHVAIDLAQRIYADVRARLEAEGLTDPWSADEREPPEPLQNLPERRRTRRDERTP
jgi:hypothetical protein